MANEIKITVRVRNLVARGLEGAKRSLAQFRTFANGVMRGVGVAAKGAAVGFGLLGVALKKSFEFETYRTQFATLLGSMDAAKSRFKELVALSEETPFTPKQIVQASKSLEQFGITGQRNIQVLRQIGDAAASLDPTKLEEIAFAIGRLEAGASAGLVGEPTMRLLELGLISADTKKQLEELAKSTKSSTAVMALASRDMARFEGGMAKLAQTGQGLVSTFLGKLDIAFATFGDEVAGFAKGTLKDLNKGLEELTNSQRFKEWAQTTAQALETIKSLLTDIFKGGSSRQQAFADIKTILSKAAQGAVDVLVRGAAIAGSVFGDALISGPSMADVKEAQKRVLEQQGFSGGNQARFLALSDKETDAKVRAEAKRVYSARIAAELAASGQAGGTIAEIIARRGGVSASSSSAESTPPGQAKTVGQLDPVTFGKMVRGMVPGISPGIIPGLPSGLGPTSTEILEKVGGAVKKDGGKSLTVGDLFERAYGGTKAKPDGSKSRPLNVVVNNFSEQEALARVGKG